MNAAECAVPSGRRIETPASGHTIYAQPHDGDYRLVGLDGETIGWLRGVRHGSRRAWSIALDYNGEFAGRYVDMAHAAQGVVHHRSRRPAA